MLIHYFITGLKPFSLDDPSLLSSNDFMKKARDCLEGSLLRDLERLLIFKNKLLNINNLHQEAWWDFFSYIKNDVESKFLFNLFEELQLFYINLSLIFADNNVIKSELNIKQNLTINNKHNHFLCDLKKSLLSISPFIREKNIILFTFSIADNLIDNDTFSCDQILCYLYKLIMKERLQIFNKKNGQIILDKIIANIAESINGYKRQ